MNSHLKIGNLVYARSIMTGEVNSKIYKIVDVYNAFIQSNYEYKIYYDLKEIWDFKLRSGLENFSRYFYDTKETIVSDKVTLCRKQDLRNIAKNVVKSYIKFIDETNKDLGSRQQDLSAKTVIKIKKISYFARYLKEFA